ncbi:MAG TPA: ATP-binding protein [Solirubrobacteraceae bacterium]|nr:ATP-binding protein [Solirubrobacteraceae bacterium]
MRWHSWRASRSDRVPLFLQARRWLIPRALGADRPPAWVGVLVAALGVALATAAIYPLKSVAPTVSLSVVYLPAVLLVSVYWGLPLGLLTSLASAAAFNYFHIPPVGRFTIADSRNWVALAAFTLVAAVVSAMAEVARNRAVEAERRRGEADLAAELARELLSRGNTQAALSITARRVSELLQIPSAAIELGAVQSQDRLAVPLHGGDSEQIGTLLVPRDLPADTVDRLISVVVPSLEALLELALHRDVMQAEAVETAALRRSDELKTALLRSVSHDLRTPITAVVTAGHALQTRSLTEEDRHELTAAVVDEGERLSALIDKLLDLSRLAAGRADSQPDWISVEEALLSAREALPAQATVRLWVDSDVPPVRADAVQLRQAFVNLLENAWRYSDGLPVSVRVRRGADHVIVRIVDQGPGITSAEQERIFEPFYRGRQGAARRWTGSGLGLAIARGFVEANGGTISVDSLPGQGTSFVVELPVTVAQAPEATVA